MGEYLLLRQTVQAIVADLQYLRTAAARFACLQFAALAQYRDAQVPDFASPLLFRQHGPQFVVREQGVLTGVELVNVNGLDPQRAQRVLELAQDSFDGKIVRAVRELVKMMAKLGRHDPARAIVPRQIVPDQPLRRVVSVTLRRINQVDAAFGGFVEDGVRVGLQVIAAPFAAELPRADADDRDAQASAAQSAVLHVKSHEPCQFFEAVSSDQCSRQRRSGRSSAENSRGSQI